MENGRLKYLFEKYLNKTYSLSEKDELFQLISQARYYEDLRQAIEETWNGNFLMHDQDGTQADLIFRNILEQGTRTRGRIRRIKFWRYVAAASIICAIGIGSYLLFFSRNKQAEVAQTQQVRFKNDIGPGKYKAKLTLANGSTIVLDSAKAGELARQGSVSVFNKDGQLTYNRETASRYLSGVKSEILYNTLSTGRGETYATTLSDGSKVWLNSESSIKFPVAFVGSERRVEITGEAYFEIKHNQRMPFKVMVNGMEVHDLGTEFNIHAYSDETVITTTLVTGNAEVVNGNKKQKLNPGQQVKAGDNGELSFVNNADVEQATAWKNGRFYFDGADIKTVMRQLSRWYDLEVQYKADINYSFVAKISRDVPVSELLKILELTGLVHFKIEGNKVTVMK